MFNGILSHKLRNHTHLGESISYYLRFIPGQMFGYTEQLKDRPSYHQSAIRAYVDLLAIRGTIYHKGLGMIYWTLPGIVEVQCTRRHGTTA